MKFKNFVFYIFENYVITTISRKNVCKLLLKLPSNIFPSYRVQISSILIENNVRRLTLGVENYSNSSNWDSSEEQDDDSYGCCKYCRKLCYEEQECCTSTEDEEYKISESNVIEDTPVFEILEPAKSYSENYSEFLKHKVDDGLMLTPPLRKITIRDLTSVKLRKCMDSVNIPRTPEVNDMLNILRKRYAVMHSPSYLKDSSSNSDWCDESVF